jgi:hypothetical protein
MTQNFYDMQPTGECGSGALAYLSHAISPWAGFGIATPAQERHTANGAKRPTSLTERLTG